MINFYWAHHVLKSLPNRCKVLFLPEADGKKKKAGSFWKKSEKLLSKEVKVSICISSSFVSKVSTDLNRCLWNHDLIYKYVIDPLVNENYRKSQVSVTKIIAYMNKVIKSAYMNETIKFAYF